MKSLSESELELKKAKLDYVGSPLPNEMPVKPFGVFVEPTQITNQRSKIPVSNLLSSLFIVSYLGLPTGVDG